MTILFAYLAGCITMIVMGYVVDLLQRHRQVIRDAAAAQETATLADTAQSQRYAMDAWNRIQPANTETRWRH